jgi:hypothetical protein
MLGATFYNESTRKALIAFGTLFNNITIKRVDSSENVQSILVPLAYAPRARFRQILAQASTDTETQFSLPRMSFEWTAIAYDTTRKLNTMQKTAVAVEGDASQVIYHWQRVPYNLDISLAIACDQTEDGLKIVEQILPYFTPELTITINDVIKHDMPVVLMDVSQEDQWEGSFVDERRLIIWTINFQLKTYLFGPSATSKVVTEAIAQMYSNTFADFDTIGHTSADHTETIDADGKAVSRIIQTSSTNTKTDRPYES